MEEIYDVESVAKLLKVGKAAVRNYIKRGWLRSAFIGRKYIILESDLVTFIKNNRLTKSKIE